MWPDIMTSMENFVNFLAGNVIVNQDDFNVAEYAEKLVAMATNNTSVAQFVGVYQVRIHIDVSN